SEPIQAGPMPDVKGIAAGDGQVWLSHITDNTVTRIDASSMSILGTPIVVGALPGQLAVGDQYAFVVNTGDKTVSALGRDGLVATTFEVPGEPAGIEIVDGTIWVLTQDTVVPIDERTFVVGSPVPLQGAYAATAGDGGVFGAFPVTDEVRWFDVKGEESKGPAVPGVAKGVTELTYVDGTLWVVDGPGREVVRIKVP
ncbi:MAG: hypothetical protein ABW137_26950, partial [Mycobacterium sp.]